MGHRPTLIEIARAEKGMTQAELVKDAKVSHTTLVNLERRRHIPKVPVLLRLSKSLDLYLEDVLADLHNGKEEAS